MTLELTTSESAIFAAVLETPSGAIECLCAVLIRRANREDESTVALIHRIEEIRSHLYAIECIETGEYRKNSNRVRAICDALKLEGLVSELFDFAKLEPWVEMTEETWNGLTTQQESGLNFLRAVTGLSVSCESIERPD